MLKISDILHSDFDWDDVCLDEDEYERLSNELLIDYLKKHDPHARQQLVTSWNFDNGNTVLQWIVEQPDTDKGTILLLYWYMNPSFFKQYADRNDCISQGAAWALEDYDLLTTIEHHYLSGFYQSQVYGFDPKADPYNNGYDWTQENQDTQLKAQIPDEMLVSLAGTTIEPPDWPEGIPSELIDIMDKLCEAVED